MKINLTMMAKNEQELLPQCLKSIEGLWDTGVMVDTGSTDDTIKIAEKVGLTIYHHPWENDYSLHRNQSISYAPADTDWIFIIDPDEEFFGDIAKLREYLEGVPPEVSAVSIPLHDVHGGEVKLKFNSPRIFRNGYIHYRYAKHNTVYLTGGFVIYPDVYLKHYGYDLSPERMKEKDAATVKGLKKRLIVDPSDYATYFYLAQTYGTIDVKESLNYAEQYIKYRKDIQGFNVSIFFTGAQAAFAVGDMAKSKEMWAQGLAEIPNDIDLNWIRCQWGGKEQDINEMYEGAVGFVRAYQEYQADQSTQGDRFVFQATEEAYAFCLYHLAAISLRQGVSAVNGLRGIELEAARPMQEKLNKMLAEIKEGI